MFDTDPGSLQWSSSPHLLVVEDDTDIADLVLTYFVSHGFKVSSANSAAAMHAILGSEEIDAILLDLGLPDSDGLTVTRYLRERWQGLLIIISGRTDSVDRVVALELGADDYVAKPFDLRELLARVRSGLRRTHSAHVTPTPPVAEKNDIVVRFSGFRLDMAAHELFDPQGKQIPLTTAEFDLLRVLIAHANRVISRDDLMNLIYGREAGPYDRAIDAQIGRLRRKIEPDPARPVLIKSVRSAGYLFAARVERSRTG